MASSELPMIRRPAYAVVFLAALVLTGIFLRRVASYWAFFDMGAGGGPGMALVFVVLPLVLLVSAVAGVVTLRHASSRGVSPGRAILRAVGATALLLTALFAVEVLRTKDLRTAEAPGTLGEYFRQHPW